MAYTVLINGQQALTRITDVLNILENPEEMWNAIGYSMKENTRLRISDQVDVNGMRLVQSWRVLEEGGYTLRDTGRLMNSITYFADKNGVEWGIPAEFPYARILNEGGVINAKNKPFLRFKVGGRWISKRSVRIPARKIVGISASDRAEILDIIAHYLKG